jgi:8-oxo-dGTP diphosphatase
MLKKIEHVHVACAILFRENHLFAAKRGANQRLSGYWEFPGGKIKYQESPSACVVRELKEELDMDVLPEECLDVVVHQYEDLKVSLYPIRCTLQSNAYKLKEHSEAGWFSWEQVAKLSWAPADILIIKKLLDGMEDLK